MKQKTKGIIIGISIGVGILIIVLLCILLVQLKENIETSDTIDASQFSEEELLDFLDDPEVVLCYTPEADALEALEDDCYYVNNVLIIYMEPDATENDRRGILRTLDAELIGLDNLSGSIQVKLPKSFSADELERICDKIAEKPTVFDAFYDIAMPVEENAVPNDPFEGSDWDRNLDDANWAWEAINAPDAWDYVNEMEPVSIGVIDSGFWGMDGHSDLQDVDHTLYNGSQDIPSELHGSQVASVLAATANNNKGMAGVAANIDKLYLMPINWEADAEDDQSKVLTYTGRLESCISKLLTNSRTAKTLFGGVHPVKIINISQGITGKPLGKELEDLFAEKLSVYLLLTLFQGQQKYENFDFQIIQTAGNGKDNLQEEPVEAKNNGFFASITEENCVEPRGTFEVYTKKDILDRIMIVGSFTHEGNTLIADSGASWGETVDILAPGRDVLCISGEKIQVDANKSYWLGAGWDYSLCDGTSFGAPMVSGTAAMVWGINPELSGPEVKQILRESTEIWLAAPNMPEFCDETGTPYSYPTLNAGMAVEAAQSWRKDDLQEEPENMESEESTITESDDELDSKLIDLIGVYGLIATGTDEYPCDPAKGQMDVPVPTERLSGILSADIADYDGDSENELITIRLEAQDPITEWNDVADQMVTTPQDTLIHIEVYDRIDGIQLVGSLTIPYYGLTDGLASAAIHVFKSDFEGRSTLYFDYYYTMGSQSFGVIQINYENGQLYVEDGVECSEFSHATICDYNATDQALESLAGRHWSEDRTGWTLGDWYEYDWVSEKVEFFRPYCEEYKNHLNALQLEDYDSRTFTDSETVATQFVDINCAMHPLDHYNPTMGGQGLTELCGVSCPYAQGGVYLTCYDSSQIMTQYRN